MLAVYRGHKQKVLWESWYRLAQGWLRVPHTSPVFNVSTALSTTLSCVPFFLLPVNNSTCLQKDIKQELYKYLGYKKQGKWGLCGEVNMG